METRFDLVKDKANIAKHGVSLARAFDMDLDAGLTIADTRFDYSEDRYVTIAPLGSALFVLAHTYRNDEIRPISLRKATKQEARLYRDAL